MLLLNDHLYKINKLPRWIKLFLYSSVRCVHISHAIESSCIKLETCRMQINFVYGIVPSMWATRAQGLVM